MVPVSGMVLKLQTKRIGAYLRKMAIDGYIIYVDTKDIKEMNKLLSAIGRNINQIAKRVNAEGSTYQADMEEIRERLDQPLRQGGAHAQGAERHPRGGAGFMGRKTVSLRLYVKYYIIIKEIRIHDCCILPVRRVCMRKRPERH